VKKILASFVMFLLTATLASSCVAAQSEAEVRQALAKTFPGMKVGEIRGSDIPGLYEVEAGSNVIYFYPDKGLLVFGEIWTRDGKNVTAERRAQLASAKIKELPLDKAVKIGNGRNKVIEFTDPDCPYCRKAAGFFKGRDDVTLYVFFFPLPIHKDAEAHARYVLCAADKAHALEEVMNGQLDGKEAPACTDKKVDALLKEHMDMGSKLGVRATPAFWINGQYVAGANIPAMEGILGKNTANHTQP
jgi:thiol:disulfide interchange protein DsbC